MAKNNLAEFAKSELERVLDYYYHRRIFKKDGTEDEIIDEEGEKIQREANDNVMKIIDLYSQLEKTTDQPKQAQWENPALDENEILAKLFNKEPLTPLTGENDEWEDEKFKNFDDRDEENKKRTVQINKRCRHVYRFNNDNKNAIRAARLFNSDDYDEGTKSNGNVHCVIDNSDSLDEYGSYERIQFPYNGPYNPVIINEDEMFDNFSDDDDDDDMFVVNKAEKKKHKKKRKKK